jgi:hypothetical protein
MKMEQTECSETLAFKLQPLGNNPEETIRRNQECYSGFAKFAIPVLSGYEAHHVLTGESVSLSAWNNSIPTEGYT